MSPTYGEHSELAAAALRELVVDAHLPVNDTEVVDLLACREAVVDALRERLHCFGITAQDPPSMPKRALPPSASPLKALTQVDIQLGSLLDRVVREIPRSHPDRDPRRPSDLLGPRHSHRTVELWRQVAVELMAGTHALETSDDRSWARHHGAGWYVARDVATAVEATVLLDRRLHDVGLLSQHDRPVGSGSTDEHRLIASHVARVATWYATSSSPDEATAQPHRHLRHAQPAGSVVHLVSTPTDVVTAQQQLARYLNPLDSHSVHFRHDPHLSAGTARQVVTSQLFVCDFLQQACESQPKATPLADHFSTQRELLGAVLPRMAYLTDRRPYEGDRHTRHQQVEITYAISGWARDSKAVSFTSAQLSSLANSTRDVTQTLAVSLRRELGRPDSNLGRAHPIHKTRITQYSKHHGLYVALTDLANAPAPTTPISEHYAPMQRAALRLTLDLTPTDDATPMPYLAPAKWSPNR